HCAPRHATSYLSHAPPLSDLNPLSLPDALPISSDPGADQHEVGAGTRGFAGQPISEPYWRCSPLAMIDSSIVGSKNSSKPNSSSDRKSTCLNSSHVKISYAVFCLKKKKKQLSNH